TTEEQREKFHPLFFDEKLYDSYYNGMCNGVLWPLFHYESGQFSFSEHAWSAYQQVNRAFAERLIEISGEDDLVWVHDYHLFLVPGMLKAIKPKLKVGFFLHIPFPSSEVFRILPSRVELLDSLVQADLVGFHSYDYLRHF